MHRPSSARRSWQNKGLGCGSHVHEGKVPCLPKEKPMKRKVYTTRRERVIDRIIGFLAFPLVNVPLGIILWLIPQTAIFSRTSNPGLLLVLISALPWLVNGIVIVLAFLLRPQLGIGYMAFIAIALALVGVLSVVFVAACFVTIVAVLSFPGM